ncbi:polysaccharide deacetylase family protein [bacterium]|nr:polysaccharide deacetylase family protein [bacterium]
MNKYFYGALNIFYPLINRFRYRKVDDEKALYFYLSFDCDYSKDVLSLPALLDTLNKANVKASFACVGKWIELYPEEHKLIISNGHEILNHTYSHPDNKELNPDLRFSHLTNEDIIKEIGGMHTIAREVLNYSPVGFRLPHFGAVANADFDFIFKVLDELGYKYDSSALDFNTGNIPKEHNIREFPVSTCPVHPYTAFDTYHIFRSKRLIYGLFHRGSNSFADSFMRLLNFHKRSKTDVNVYFDPADIMKNCNLEPLIKEAKDMGFNFTRYRDRI